MNFRRRRKCKQPLGRLIAAYNKTKATRLVLQIENDLSNEGFISPKRLRRLEEQNISIGSILNTYGTNLIGSCYSPCSVQHLTDLGCPLNDPTGKIGLWCDVTILTYLVNRDMDFSCTFQLLTKRLNDPLEEKTRIDLNERQQILSALVQSRRSAIHDCLADWSYDDLSLCVLRFI
jgi:hypothetical protein